MEKVVILVTGSEALLLPGLGQQVACRSAERANGLPECVLPLRHNDPPKSSTSPPTFHTLLPKKCEEGSELLKLRHPPPPRSWDFSRLSLV